MKPSCVCRENLRHLYEQQTLPALIKVCSIKKDSTIQRWRIETTGNSIFSFDTFDIWKVRNVFSIGAGGKTSKPRCTFLTWKDRHRRPKESHARSVPFWKRRFLSARYREQYRVYWPLVFCAVLRLTEYKPFPTMCSFSRSIYTRHRHEWSICMISLRHLEYGPTDFAKSSRYADKD